MGEGKEARGEGREGGEEGAPSEVLASLQVCRELKNGVISFPRAPRCSRG